MAKNIAHIFIQYMLLASMRSLYWGMEDGNRQTLQGISGPGILRLRNNLPQTGGVFQKISLRTIV